MKLLVTANTSWNLLHFRRALLTGLLADGHEIVVLAPDDDATPTLRAMGCECIALKMDRKGVSVLNDGALLLAFRAMIRAHRPDLILSYTIKNNIFCGIAARLARVRFIPNVTGLGTAFLGSSALQSIAVWLYRRAFSHLPLVFFQNADDRDLFVTLRICAKQNTQLLPGSGIDLSHFAPTVADDKNKDGRMTFLMISRLLKDKGVGEFVEAARKMRQSHPKVRMQILGGLDFQNRSAFTQSDLDGWIAEEVIEYLGETDDVRPAIAAADCVVLPSYREGAPRALIEAAAMAKPAVATDVPGCNSVVEDGRTGILCKMANADDLYAKLVQMIDFGADKREEIGRAARSRMERTYDQKLVLGAYRKAIESTRAGDALRDL